MVSIPIVVLIMVVATVVVAAFVWGERRRWRS